MFCFAVFFSESSITSVIKLCLVYISIESEMLNERAWLINHGKERAWLIKYGKERAWLIKHGKERAWLIKYGKERAWLTKMVKRGRG